ncbi:DNA polymerase III subunit psi [Leminorella richardii]|uniref:DNA polymerase III subunit psi n=1 Tax=Leminorella richardii TaxID=158841 RepID=A0A2X4UA05_9GAMM|nr:DNA polymerase III subunit psi [Leminorella richardii]SQI36616.1 DNA polymerase III subunit psi [Leminorella richardii]
MATSRRDWQLEQMGIRQYRLTRPAALRGEVAITIPDDVKVIVICQTMPESASPLWLDLLRAMALTSDRVYCLMLDNVMMIPESVRCAFWLLGLDEAPALPSALQTLPVLNSPSLDALSTNPEAKRLLWQQISHHEHHFFPHAERPDSSLSN